jgi:hypothetical protein
VGVPLINVRADEEGENMTVTIHLLLAVVALVLFALAGLGMPEPPRVHFLPWALFFWLLSSLVIR